MKLSFYVKLLLTFLFATIFMLTFSVYLFTYFYKKHYETKETQNIKSLLEYEKKSVDEYLNRIKSKVNALNENYFEVSSSKLQYVLKSNMYINTIAYYALNGDQILKIEKLKNGKIEESKSKFLRNISKEDYYRKLVSLDINETYISSFELDKNRNKNAKKSENLSTNFVKRVKNGFIVLSVDSKSLLNRFKNVFANNKLFIIDEEGYFIDHEKDELDFSKYYAVSETLEKHFPKYYKDILSKPSFQTEKFITRKYDLSYEKSFVVLIKLDDKAQISYFKEFEKYIYSIIMVGLFLAVILALLFSEPIAKQNEKINKKNRDLDFDNRQNMKELSNSTKILNKSVMFIRLNKEGQIINVSDALCDFTGFAKEELLGHHHRILIAKDIKREAYQEVWDKLNNKEAIEVEIKSVKKNGTSYFSQSYFEPIIVSNDLTGFIEIRQDITDKKTISDLCDNINFKVQEYNAIFDNVNSGIALIDEEGNFKTFNNMFMKLLGFSKEELEQLSLKDLVYKTSIELIKEILNEVKEIGDIPNMEKVFLNKNGEKIHLEISLSILPDKSSFVLVINSLEDKRKLQELNQNLEKKIEQEVEKSRQKDKIHQEERIKSTKLSTIGALAAGITHEINTPLTYIKGNFEMMTYDIQSLEESSTKKYMLEDCEKIKDGISRIENIVESMREVSQASNEVKEDVNIYSTIITALTMAYNRSKQISKVFIQGSLFTIDTINKDKYHFISNVQKQRIEQVWIVIINNALDELTKVMDYENRKLNIDLYEENDDIVITFKDNAGGIDENIVENIFEPFVSSKQQGGIGIGLNIAKKIVDEQNGKISAYNSNNQAIFEVRLKNANSFHR